jgi:DNA mismatch repair ATPase MutS
MTDTRDQYARRQAQFEQTAGHLRRRYDRVALLRLLFFVIAIGAIILLWSVHYLLGLGFIFVFLGLFYRFVQWHQGIQERARFAEDLAAINEDEQAFLRFDIDRFESGEQFLDPDHPYALDLDLFGSYSIFQYVNRSSTAIGRRRLAEILQQKTLVDIVYARQQAIAELGPALDWRQELQAWGRETKDEEKHIRLLEYWLAEPPFVANRPWLVWATRLMPFWVTAGIALWLYFSLPWFVGILFFLPPALILRNTMEQVNTAHGHTAHAERMLSHYARLIRHIEGRTFQSELMVSLQRQFAEERGTASQQIRRLSYIISQLNVRYNIFAIILNVFSLWDLHWIYRLERWKAAHRERLPHWFEALQEFEALNSLATTYYNNPDWVFPVFEEEARLEGTELGHPLLPPAKRVCNDLQMPTDGHIKLITGSNMAGKSTFLRTVGLNIALANVGAPVCARSLRLPPLQVYTSMRTQDALHESTSSFYAELKRLQVIIDAVEDRREPVFFLLDEILKGTNSRDRHTGSKALIKQLIQSKGAGLIATHDLELGSMEAQAGGAIENLCMEVEIRNNQLFFDYKLKKGVSRSFNATLLMKNMGIRIDVV